MLLQYRNFSTITLRLFCAVIFCCTCVTAILDTTSAPQANFNLSRTATTETQLSPHSRKRRYVAFPEGSSVSAAICLTVGVIGNPNVAYLSWAENWGVAYNLPNYTWARQNANGFKNELKDTKAMIQRRSRRDLYEKIEILIDNMGFNGHACIARALCESSKYLHKLRQKRSNMIVEIVKTIFSFPKERVHGGEPDIIHHYDRIYRRARRDLSDCSVEYGDCHISLLELAFGKYSVPPTKHGTGAGKTRHFSFM